MRYSPVKSQAVAINSGLQTLETQDKFPAVTRNPVRRTLDMAQLDRTLVMDILPWPKGRGFSGVSAWWDYVLSKDEQGRLDNLMGVALLDGEVRERLIKRKDETLFSAFGLSTETKTWINSLNVASLDELAQEIISHS
jgi:hypothetical protein